MSPSKQFKNKIWRLATVFCLLALVFNFSLVRAEETTLSEDTSSAPETPAAEVPAVTAEIPVTEPAITIEESAPLIDSRQAPTSEVILENPLESVENPVEPPTPLIPPLSGGTTTEGQGAENLTPQITTTTEPIIFNLGPSTDSTSSPQASSEQDATETPETNNNVAEASEINPILHEILTGIVRDASIKGLTILAQWQMGGEKAEGKYLGKDDSALVDAQILPSGQFEVNKPAAICALVADAEGLNDIKNIMATINYPETAAKTINQAGDASTPSASSGQAGSAQVKTGCGGLIGQVSLEKVDAMEANGLVCDQLRSNNNNLLSWGSDKIENIVYSYEHICGNGGLLTKGVATLYCAETALAYDDPAGDYMVKVIAENNAGSLVTGENILQYLELTTFENDFTDILYGPVKLNETKVLKGDLVWGEGTDPTVRNTGNTRLKINIWQNDFGLGKTGESWNLNYQAKVGTSTEFIGYAPEQAAVLDGILELGQTNSMDFTVLINKFPDNDSAYWGKMTLSADKVAPLGCQL